MHMTIGLTTLALGFLAGYSIYWATRKGEYEKQDAKAATVISALAVVATLFITIAPAQAGYIETGEGEQSGFVTAIESGGIIHKTTAVFIKTDRESSTHETYCITDPALVEQLKDARDNNQRITISYAQHLLWGKGCEWEVGASQVIHAVRADPNS